MTHGRGLRVIPSQSGFRLIDEEPNVYTFAMHRNVNIYVWVGAARGDITDRSKQIVAEQVPQYPQGLSTVHVMTHLAAPPTPEARRGFAEIGERFQSSVISVSLVIEREGFWGSAMRSAVTGVQLLMGRADYPVKVHASVEETAVWMPTQHAQRSGVRLDPGEFLTALRSVRAYTVAQAESHHADLSRSA
jgi:hypothetical protein